jgi:hypothetical protein
MEEAECKKHVPCNGAEMKTDSNIYRVPFECQIP